MILVLRSASFALPWMIKKTMEQQVDFTYNEFLYQNGQTNKLQSNIKYPGYRLKKDFKNVTHNIKALKDVYWKRPILCQNTLRMCSVLVELVFYRTYWRAPQIVKSCHPGCMIANSIPARLVATRMRVVWPRARACPCHARVRLDLPCTCARMCHAQRPR